eukprot:1140464-Pelagomonas_calceolata.AAC.5
MLTHCVEALPQAREKNCTSKPQVLLPHDSPHIKLNSLRATQNFHNGPELHCNSAFLLCKGCQTLVSRCASQPLSDDFQHAT